MAYRKFIDKDPAGNLQNGLEFYAAGLVVSDYLDSNGTGNASGKDYAVEFINPWGNYCHEWRSVDEIVISEIAKVDYEYLKLCYND